MSPSSYAAASSASNLYNGIFACAFGGGPFATCTYCAAFPFAFAGGGAAGGAAAELDDAAAPELDAAAAGFAGGPATFAFCAGGALTPELAADGALPPVVFADDEIDIALPAVFDDADADADDGRLAPALLDDDDGDDDGGDGFALCAGGGDGGVDGDGFALCGGGAAGSDFGFFCFCPCGLGVGMAVGGAGQGIVGGGCGGIAFCEIPGIKGGACMFWAAWLAADCCAALPCAISIFIIAVFWAAKAASD